MKKLLIIIPLVLLSCKKEATVLETKTDSAQAIDQTTVVPNVDSAQIKDSMVNNAPATKEVLRTGVMRDVKGKTITREADGSQLPFSIGEEFTEEGQEFVLKIKNFEGKKISVRLTPADENQNIRINQIKAPNENTDGPFGREISKDISEKGEVLLVIGRNNIASGETKGKFSVFVE